jgi:hypothetical protein
MGILDELKSLTQAGADAAPAPVAAVPAPVAAKAADSDSAKSTKSAAAPTPDVVVEAAANISHEPTIVKYEQEAAVVSVPAGNKVFDEAQKLLGYLTPDGKFTAVSESPEDSLARLNEADRRPVSAEEEARVDLAQRTSGRISFLTATYESEKEDPKYPERREKRLKNDIHRGLAARPASIFDPEKTKAAEAINKWKHV